jgi:hypothetical protein
LNEPEGEQAVEDEGKLIHSRARCRGKRDVHVGFAKAVIEQGCDDLFSERSKKLGTFRSNLNSLVVITVDPSKNPKTGGNRQLGVYIWVFSAAGRLF